MLYNTNSHPSLGIYRWKRFSRQKLSEKGLFSYIRSGCRREQKESMSDSVVRNKFTKGTLAPRRLINKTMLWRIFFSI